jgi:hypothetical protein
MRTPPSGSVHQQRHRIHLDQHAVVEMRHRHHRARRLRAAEQFGIDWLNTGQLATSTM